MHRRRPFVRLAAGVRPPLALVLCLGLVLTACSGGSDEPAADESPATDSASPSATESPYLPVPDDVELTDQGSELDFGDVASVAWRPRTTTTGVLDVEVKAVERAPMSAFSDFRLDKQTRQSSAYFVRVRITNTGENDLAGAAIPLYLVDGENTLIQASTFASRFAPCPSRPFPRGFTPGEKISTCLVYLAPNRGDAEAVSFRPSQAFNPIVWTGEETKYQPPGAKKKQNKKNNQQQKKQQKNQ